MSDWLWNFKLGGQVKLRPSYDPSCVIFSSFNFTVIFNIGSADIAESQFFQLVINDLFHFLYY